MYISDHNNHRVRKITASTNVITTIAGTGTAGYNGDGGAATAANIANPCGVNLDSSANVYISNLVYNVIRKVTVSTGIISTVAGTGSTSGGYNGDNMQATAATLNYPFDVVLDSYGNLYIADRNNHRIRKVTVSTGVITTVVGTGTASSTGDGSAVTSASIKGPCYSRFDSSGNYYITECGAYGSNDGSLIRKGVTVSTDIPTISPSFKPSLPPTQPPSFSPSYGSGYITTSVGTGTISSTGDGGAASSATVNYPHGVAFDSGSNILYISELFGYYVRKVDMSTGIITKYAGTGTSCSGVACTGLNGAATSAKINPTGLCLQSNGDLIISGYNAYRVLKVSSNIITSIAGTGTATVSGDNGPATSATMKEPFSCQVDSSGNVYVADRGGNNIRKITSSTGIITTYAGSATGSSGSTGDSGAATSALLNTPYSIAIDASNNLFIADYSNNKIRKVAASTGIISTVVGTGTASYSGDSGPATSAAIQRPKGVLPDGAGGYYISDSCAIRYVSSTGVITTITGGSSCGITDNVIAASGRVNLPSELAYDSSGNLYVADFSNCRVRKVVGIVTIPTATPR